MLCTDSAGDLTGSALWRYWCFEGFRFPMFLQETQHLDVKRVTKVQRPTQLSPYNWLPAVPIGPNLSRSLMS